jgi:hypothetical protein
MRDASSLLLLFTACLTTTSCRDDPVRATETCQHGGATITVTRGTPPTFSWSPQCGVDYLVVARDDATADAPPMWSVSSGYQFDRSAEPNTILPGVTYGVVPNGAVAGSPAQPLMPGTRYIVVLMAADRTPHPGTYTVATRAFVP